MLTSVSKNIREAEDALTSKPLFATSAERILILDELKSQYKELPQPKRFAKTLAVLLSRVSVPLMPYDLIAGRCVDRLLTDEEEAIFQAYIHHPDYTSNLVFLSSGHCTYAWEDVAKLGLGGLRKNAQARLEQPCNVEQRIFLEAVLEIYDVIEAYLLRYADAAAQAGMSELAENLKKAASDRPDTFAATLQLLWIITLIDCAYITKNPTLTVGRLDQILYPLYQSDLQNSRLTRERAAAYITDYYCKHNLIMGRGEHQIGDATNSTTFERICNFDAPQYMMIAGTDEHGKDAVNELTELFAACIVPSFKNPVTVVRYYQGMDQKHPALWKTLTEKSLQSASLMYYNDDNILSTYARMGLPEADYRRYTHFGCNWPSPGEDCAWMLISPKSAHYNAFVSEEERKALCIPFMRMNAEHGWPEDFMIVARGLAERDEKTLTVDDFYNGFFARMGDFIDRKLKHLSHEMAVRKRRPSALLTFGDCFLPTSVERAECFSATAKYHFELQSFYMFATVADCFIAVDQLVLKEKRLTLKQLLEAVDADFEGSPDILALCRNADKYGMDTPLSNYHARRLSHTASDLVIEKSKPYLRKSVCFWSPVCKATRGISKTERNTVPPPTADAHIRPSRKMHAPPTAYASTDLPPCSIPCSTYRPTEYCRAR